MTSPGITHRINRAGEGLRAPQASAPLSSASAAAPHPVVAPGKRSKAATALAPPLLEPPEPSEGPPRHPRRSPSATGSALGVLTVAQASQTPSRRFSASASLNPASDSGGESRESVGKSSGQGNSLLSTLYKRFPPVHAFAFFQGTWRVTSVLKHRMKCQA